MSRYSDLINTTVQRPYSKAMDYWAKIKSKNKPIQIQKIMQVEGRITHIGQTETIGEKGFTKRLLVIQTDSEYNNQLPVEFHKDKVNLLDALTIGSRVKIDINLGGREWNGKYFASITGWKIEAQAVAPSRVATTPMATQAPQQVADPEDDDLLPF